MNDLAERRIAKRAAELSRAISYVVVAHDMGGEQILKGPTMTEAVSVVLGVSFLVFTLYVLFFAFRKTISFAYKIIITGKRHWKRWQLRNLTSKDSVLEYLRRILLHEIPHMCCDNEVEVEIKFIEPLLRALGYSSNDFKVRVPVSMRLGRQRVNGVADWLVFEKTTRRAHCIIEAKAKNMPLTQDAVDQARSYAHALSTPYYMITNAVDLRIYQRSLPEDRLLFETSVEKMRTAWATLESIIGACRRLPQNDPIGQDFLRKN